MTLSPYFRHLRSAYSAELDDLTFDSEGLHVLDKRLVQRRKEMEFLVHMMEISPEMVATVFHRGFRFTSLATMDHLVTLEPEDLPDWDSLVHAFDMEPWTQALIAIVQKHPKGDWFLGVAAALEYLHNKPEHTHGTAVTEDEDENEHPTDILDDEEQEAKAREEAGADWMVEQGFDRKE